MYQDSFNNKRTKLTWGFSTLSDREIGNKSENKPQSLGLLSRGASYQHDRFFKGTFRWQQPHNTWKGKKRHSKPTSARKRAMTWRNKTDDFPGARVYQSLISQLCLWTLCSGSTGRAKFLHLPRLVVSSVEGMATAELGTGTLWLTIRNCSHTREFGSLFTMEDKFKSSNLLEVCSSSCGALNLPSSSVCNVQHSSVKRSA